MSSELYLAAYTAAHLQHDGRTKRISVISNRMVDGVAEQDNADWSQVSLNSEER